MKVDSLQIFYRKRFLKRSLASHSLSLCVWLAIYVLVFLPFILNRPSDVGIAEHIILNTFITVVFFSWSIALVRIVFGCISGFKKAPCIAYTFTDEGISGDREGWFVYWDDILIARTIVKSAGYSIQNNEKKFYAIKSWGIDPTEMDLAKNYILDKLPSDKTKKLK